MSIVGRELNGPKERQTSSTTVTPTGPKRPLVRIGIPVVAASKRLENGKAFSYKTIGLVAQRQNPSDCLFEVRHAMFFTYNFFSSSVPCSEEPCTWQSLLALKISAGENLLHHM